MAGPVRELDRTFGAAQKYSCPLSKTFSATILLRHFADDIQTRRVCRDFFHMPVFKQKLRLLAAFSALLMLALAAGCKGFFRESHPYFARGGAHHGVTHRRQYAADIGNGNLR